MIATYWRSKSRRLWWGAGLCAVVFAIAACSHSGSSATFETTSASSAARTPAPRTSPAKTKPTARAAPATTRKSDPAAMLKTAVAGLTSSYHFVSTVRLNGSVVLVADGDRVGSGSRLTLTSHDGTASYVITPAGSWVMTKDAGWQALTSDPPSTDPISALRTPNAVRETASDGKTAELAVTVPPASLGVDGTAPVVLGVTITSKVLSAVSYGTTVGGKPASVTATFGPVHDRSPVRPPA